MVTECILLGTSLHYNLGHLNLWFSPASGLHTHSAEVVLFYSPCPPSNNWFWATHCTNSLLLIDVPTVTSLTMDHSPSILLSVFGFTLLQPQAGAASHCASHWRSPRRWVLSSPCCQLSGCLSTSPICPPCPAAAPRGGGFCSLPDCITGSRLRWLCIVTAWHVRPAGDSGSFTGVLAHGTWLGTPAPLKSIGR